MERNRWIFRLEDTVGEGVEEERRDHQRGQPARFDDRVADAAKASLHMPPVGQNVTPSYRSEGENANK